MENAVNSVSRRRLLFTTLSMLWIFPSLGAIWILYAGRGAWRSSLTLPERVKNLTLEQWIALGLLLLHGVFVALALYFRRLENRQSRGTKAATPTP
jgi:hypothetical protein